MARTGYVETIVGGLDSTVKKAFIGLSDYFTKNWRWGRPGHQVQAENLAAVFLQGVTPAVANTPFTIEHGLGTAPYLLIPVLDLNTVGDAMPRLTVTAPADARRIYVSAAVTNAPFTVLVEG